MVYLMIYDVIYSLLVLNEKMTFLKKQLQGFIISSMTCIIKYDGKFYLQIFLEEALYDK